MTLPALLLMAKQHIALGLGGLLTVIAFPFVLRFIKNWVMKEFGMLISVLLLAGDDSVDRLTAHALAVLAAEIPDNLTGDEKVQHLVDVLIVRFPHLEPQKARLEKLVNAILEAIDERAKVGAGNLKVTLLTEDKKTIIEPK